jgi:hypothetical protein
MRDVRDILVEYNEALEANDILLMAELVLEMKEVDPAFVDLMLNSIEEDE